MAQDDARPPGTAHNNWLYLGILVALVAAGLGWRNSQHPARHWASRLEHAHTVNVADGLKRCFGEATPARLRRAARDLRAGRSPAPFNRCHEGTSTNLVISPNAVHEALRDPPVEVFAIRDRYRTHLQRLQSALRVLEPVVNTARGAAPEAQREELASKVEDVAQELEAELRALEDLTAAARDAASLF
jgi:acetyl-CoA carboxylase alpha subunit